jgi:hypothetical protein
LWHMMAKSSRLFWEVRTQNVRKRILESIKRSNATLLTPSIISSRQQMLTILYLFYCIVQVEIKSYKWYFSVTKTM